MAFNPNWTGIFDIFRLGGGGGGGGGGGRYRPLIIFVVCGNIAAKFCTGIDNQSISSNIEKNLHKINEVVNNGVIIVWKLAEKTVT